MYLFKKEQKATDFGGVIIGGQPGENPTTLVGGLFFKGQPIVENTKEGLFDKELAKRWIDTGQVMMEKTGHPLILQAFGRNELAMERHLSWLVKNYDGPFMFESTNAKARMKAIEFCEEAGLSERAIYNSINLSMKDDEKLALQNSLIHMAVVLGWSPRATSLSERMETIQSSIATAENMGIKKMLIDPATLPVGAGYGLDYRAILAIKAELGLPTCLAPHNAPSAWRFIKQDGFDDEPTHMAAIIASTIAAQMSATDCIMYGSMVRTKEVFTATALIGNAIAAAVTEAQQVLGIDRNLFEPLTFE